MANNVPIKKQGFKPEFHKVDADQNKKSAQINEKSSDLQALVKFLENALGEKAPDGSPSFKIEYLRNKIKEKPAKEQVGILKELGSKFGGQKGTDQVVKSIKQDIIGSLKELTNRKQDPASASDPVETGNRFVDVQDSKITGVSKKPLEKSLGFMINFAEHQQGFFEDSSFKASEFATESDPAKELYKLSREADKFWSGEVNFLQEYKAAGESRENKNELQGALRDLFNLEIQMNSRFDMDFEDSKIIGASKSERDDIATEISNKKSEIRTLHSNLV